MGDSMKRGDGIRVDIARVESQRSIAETQDGVGMYPDSTTSSSYDCASTNSTSDNHPSGVLPNRWAVWHYKRPAQGGRGRVDKVAVLGTQQELLTQLKEVNLFEQKDAVSVNVFVFRDGIKPDKFDAANKDGGCWCVFAPDDLDPGNKTLVCQWWVKLLSMAVKELLDEHQDVIGVRVAIRNPQVAGASAIKDDSTVAQGLRDRVELWTRNAADSDKQTSIGQSIKVMLSLTEEHRITYRAHQDIFIMKKKQQKGGNEANQNKPETKSFNNNNNNNNARANQPYSNNGQYNRMNNNNNARPIGFMGIRSTASAGRQNMNNNMQGQQQQFNNNNNYRKSFDTNRVQQQNQDRRRASNTMYEVPPMQDKNMKIYEKQDGRKQYNNNNYSNNNNSYNNNNRGPGRGRGGKDKTDGQGQGPGQGQGQGQGRGQGQVQMPYSGGYAAGPQRINNNNKGANLMGHFLNMQNNGVPPYMNSNNSNAAASHNNNTNNNNHPNNQNNGYRRKSFQGGNQGGANNGGGRSRRASSEVGSAARMPIPLPPVHAHHAKREQSAPAAPPPALPIQQLPQQPQQQQQQQNGGLVGGGDASGFRQPVIMYQL